MFWRLALATCWRLTPVTKNTCLAKSGSVFKNLFQFSLELFMTIHFLSQLILTETLRVTLYKFHCCTCSPPNLQEKRYGFLFSHLISRILSFIFGCICVGVLIFCYRFVSMFLESTLFLQKLKNFKKRCCPVLATQSQVIQVTCYSRELVG